MIGNKMRIFKDLDLVEQLGSGIPRILQFYEKDVFQFSENFLRIVLPAAEAITPQVEALLKIFAGMHYRSELQERLGLSDRENFRKMYLQPAVDTGLVALPLRDTKVIKFTSKCFFCLRLWVFRNFPCFYHLFKMKYNDLNVHYIAHQVNVSYI